MTNIVYSKGDDISKLKIDKIPPTQFENDFINNLFEEKKPIVSVLFSEFKNLIILGVLYIVLSLKKVDTVIYKMLPMTATSEYALIIAKAVLLMVFYWIFKHFYLSKRDR
jgi:hypothetical protein